MNYSILKLPKKTKILTLAVDKKNKKAYVYIRINSKEKRTYLRRCDAF
jgi:hypothetical protein